jgi:glutathione S-transferase
MLKIYGHPMSTCTRKVLMTLAETNAPFEMTVVDFATGEHKKEPHLGRQPFGRIPAMDDDGFALFESRAICRYLNAKTNGNLVPADPKGMAKVEQWISVETSELTPNAMKFIYNDVFKRAQEPAVLETAAKGLETTCAVMDKELAKSAFIAGGAFSLSDICYMPYFEYAMTSKAKEIIAKYPHVMTWWNKISERPTWRKATGKAT